MGAAILKRQAPPPPGLSTPHSYPLPGFYPSIALTLPAAGCPGLPTSPDFTSSLPCPVLNHCTAHPESYGGRHLGATSSPLGTSLNFLPSPTPLPRSCPLKSPAQLRGSASTDVMRGGRWDGLQAGAGTDILASGNRGRRLLSPKRFLLPRVTCFKYE